MSDNENKKLPQFIIDALLPIIEAQKKLNAKVIELMHEYLKNEELTQPEPRFKEFDSIYYRIGDEIHDSTINHVFDGMMQNERFYRIGKCHDMLESQLYLKKSELIEAQIAYWLSLKNEESQHEISRQNSFVCDHESDGKRYGSIYPGFALLCEKCGEFY